MTATEQRPQAPDPNESPMAEVGRSVIMVPLIIGGAIIVAIIMLWGAHARKLRLLEMNRIEAAARLELRDAFLDLRALRPGEALERAEKISAMLKSLDSRWASDYAGMKVPLNMLIGESLLTLDASNAAQAEEHFDYALAYMKYASGEMRQFGMLGRARARIELGKYEEALADLDSVVDRNPNFGAAFYWRARIHQELGDAEAAARDEDRARGLDAWPPFRQYIQTSGSWPGDA